MTDTPGKALANAWASELARRSSSAPDGQYRSLMRQATFVQHLGKCPEARHQFRLLADGSLFITIGDFGLDNSDLSPLLAAIADANKIDIVFDTAGGDGKAGLDLSEALKGKHATGHILRCCSAGILPAMQCERLTMDSSGSLMIHGASVAVYGPKAELERGIRRIQAFDRELYRVLRLRTDKPVEVLEWLQGDHWFSPEEALEARLIDEIIPAPAAPPVNEPVMTLGSDWKAKALLDFCKSLGPIETDRAALFNNLSVWLTHNVKDFSPAQGCPSRF